MNKNCSTRSSDTPRLERKPLWDIPDHLRCPVTGNCLSLSEQKRILRKTRKRIKGLSDHDIHVFFVQGSRSETPFSRRVHRDLDRKYQREVAELGTCSETEFLPLWRRGLKNGEIEGLLWVAATNPNLPGNVVDQVFADTHMLMHAQGNAVRHELQRVERLSAKNKRLSQELRAMRKSARKTKTALRASKTARSEMERRVQAMETELKRARERLSRDKQAQQLAAAREENEELRAQLGRWERRYKAQGRALDRAKTDEERLETKLASQTDVNQSLRAEMDRLLQEMLRDEEKCESCPAHDLCDRRVLLVGGITKLRAFYRDIVRDMGGEFKYHDGRTGGGVRRLESLVGWADVVLCPVDVNSHGACLSVKRTCKKLEKPYHMLESSGVSNVSRTLAGVAESC
jgi:hypothetical protein